MSFTFFMPIPESYRKKILKQIDEKGFAFHCHKPDVTNLQKNAEDCLKGIVILDDNQVVEVFSRKEYGIEAKTVIQIESLG